MSTDSDTFGKKAAARPKPHRRRGVTLETRLVLMALAAGFPAILVSLLLLWTGTYSSQTRWTLTVTLVAVWLGASFAIRGKVAYPLQTLANLLSALREEDFSIRGRETRSGSALGEAFAEVNALSDMLRGQRLSSLEATALLRKVMEEIEVAIFTFDDEQRLQLLNRAGERLLANPAERILGRTAGELGLGACLEGALVRTATMDFPGGERPVGNPAQHLPRTGPPSPDAGARQPQPSPAGRGAAGLATPDPGIGARAQQLAGANQVHGRHAG